MSRFLSSNINTITNNSLLGFVTNKGERGTILADLYHDKFIPAVLNNRRHRFQKTHAQGSLF